MPDNPIEASTSLKAQARVLWSGLWPSVLFVMPGMVLVKMTAASWLDLFSIGSGILGINLAVRGNARAKSASDALAELKAQMHRQTGSQTFYELIEPVNQLVNGVRTKDWRQTSESAIALSGKLENLGELYIGLLDGSSLKLLSDSRSTLLDIIMATPLRDVEVEEATHLDLFRKCIAVHNALQSVRGKVKLKSED